MSGPLPLTPPIVLAMLKTLGVAESDVREFIDGFDGRAPSDAGEYGFGGSVWYEHGQAVARELGIGGRRAIPVQLTEKTLASARAEFWGAVDDGATCPCCDRDAKRYRRKLNSGMVRALISLYRITKSENPPDGWINLTVTDQPGLPVRPAALRLRLHHREYTKLAFWRLLEEKPKDKPTTGTPGDGHKGSGIWRIAQLGKDFAHNLVSLPRHIYVYDNRAQPCEDSELTDIATAWDDRFDFEELMSAAADPPPAPPKTPKKKSKK
jgi:hypothetical protein